MTNNQHLVNSRLAKNYGKELKAFNRKLANLENKNDALIKHWKSIPWWRFWEKPSFEGQRSILIKNWESIDL